MRFDRGTRIFTATTTKVGQEVWAPLDHWRIAIVDAVKADIQSVRVTSGGVTWVCPLWHLREYRPHLEDGGCPDEPCPPKIGRPRGNPATKRTGLLTNGDCRGRVSHNNWGYN